MSKCDLSQSSDQNMNESIFTTTGIYIIVGASYVNLISLFVHVLSCLVRAAALFQNFGLTISM